MKNYPLMLIICALLTGCDSGSDPAFNAEQLLGFWSRETVYLNGVNSNAYVDFLNGGTNFLDIKRDKTFSRAYDNGSWALFDEALVLDRMESNGRGDWKYKIIHRSAGDLVLEIKLTGGQYCCGFDAFAEDEVITIREVYKRLN